MMKDLSDSIDVGDCGTGLANAGGAHTCLH
jgi:hypothetical protein